MVDDDGRELPHNLAGSPTGAGSKQLTLGLGGGAAAGLEGKGDQREANLGWDVGFDTGTVAGCEKEET